MTHKEDDVYCISSALRTIFFGVVSIVQLVEVTDSAVLGGVAEVVSSNPTVGHKNIFQHLPAKLICYTSPTNLYQFLILCSSKVLLL